MLTVLYLPWSRGPIIIAIAWFFCPAVAVGQFKGWYTLLFSNTLKAGYTKRRRYLSRCQIPTRIMPILFAWYLLVILYDSWQTAKANYIGHTRLWLWLYGYIQKDSSIFVLFSRTLKQLEGGVPYLLFFGGMRQTYKMPRKNNSRCFEAIKCCFIITVFFKVWDTNPCVHNNNEIYIIYSIT